MSVVPGGKSSAKDVKKAAVVGAGTMGSGIAMCFANAGIPVLLMDASAEALSLGLDKIKRAYASSFDKGKLSAEAAERCVSLVSAEQSIDAAVDVDIAIEAVSERMAVKKAVFARLDATCPPSAILASNTSFLDIDEIGAATTRPQSVCGMHFFSPAQVMPLLEVVRGKTSSVETIATALALGVRMRKRAVVAGNCFGFIGNRCLEGYIREAMYLLEEGCEPAQVDAVLADFGMAMGPFTMSDLSGNDIGYSIRKDFGLKTMHESPNTNERYYGALPDKLVEMGRLGQKTKKGWYDYSAGRKPVEDAAVTKLIETHRAEKGITPRTIDAAEILDRCLLPLVNEGFKCVEDGVATRESDVDMTYLYGYGWPRSNGGPIYWARHVREGGLPKLVEDLNRYAEQHPTVSHWKPSGLLRSAK